MVTVEAIRESPVIDEASFQKLTPTVEAIRESPVIDEASFQKLTPTVEAIRESPVIGVMGKSSFLGAIHELPIHYELR
ncbi:MAG: hypothetical protein ACRC8Y_06940 [Chroococcales cyanobacterium]